MAYGLLNMVSFWATFLIIWVLDIGGKNQTNHVKYKCAKAFAKVVYYFECLAQCIKQMNSNSALLMWDVFIYFNFKKQQNISFDQGCSNFVYDCPFLCKLFSKNFHPYSYFMCILCIICVLLVFHSVWRVTNTSRWVPSTNAECH